MIIQRLTFITFLVAFVHFAHAQNQADFIKEGNEYFKNGQLPEAISSYSKVSDEKYKHTALLNKGTALYKHKKFDDAIKTYDEIIKDPNASATFRSGAYYNAGVVYSNTNKVQESIEAYKNALRLNSNDFQARENLQKALSELKKSGGGGGEQKPQSAQSKLDKNKVQQQLDRLEQKEKNTKKRTAGKKTQFSSSDGKDW